jgi:DNA-binding transcriptional LysR family regulator
MSPSAVSEHIAALEADFGATLFVRTNRGMRLTPAGEVLLRYAESIEANWRQAFQAVHQVAAGEEAVHLAASHTVTELFLPQVLGAFRARHPQVRVRLTLRNSAGVTALVETGQVDFGIVEGAVASPALQSHSLWADELGLVVSKAHPWAERAAVRVEEVLGCDLILREEGSGTRRVFERALHEAGFALDPLLVTMELSSLRAILAMVRHNVGVSVLSRSVVFDPPEGSGLVFLPITGLRLTRRIALLTRRGDPLRPAAQEMTSLLRKAAHGAGRGDDPSS